MSNTLVSYKDSNREEVTVGPDTPLPVNPQALVTHIWSGAGDTNAPDASALGNFTYGVNNDGASTANVYWVINNAWVDTGATVANIHGA